MTEAWTPHDTRDQVIDFIHKWGGERSGLSQLQIVGWVGIARSKFYDWRARYGKANEHNAWIPRDHWIEGWEGDEIVKFAREFPLEGYRRLTLTPSPPGFGTLRAACGSLSQGFPALRLMMLDRNIVAVSPWTTYRVLKAAGLIQTWNGKPSKKGTGFVQPLAPHEHWHVDVSHINVAGTFYYLCSPLDGCSRFIVHHELRESMTEADVEIIIQRALEKHPGAKPRIISDNGPQFIAKELMPPPPGFGTLRAADGSLSRGFPAPRLKEFVCVAGLTHVKTSPYYPQSNGKIERWHKSLKADCIRPGTPLDIEQARRLIANFVEHYNTVRLHSAIGYITPQDKLLGKEKAIFAARDKKLAQARRQRKIKRQNQPAHSLTPSLAFSN